ncbi:conserved hypothetical protein [Methylocella silvestris BL2]|uniref:CHAT domain-containing protein n=1 Tax=Methylocella silvestris (strain DSM 15510 / CIP 108128 / LMG 27833 / NCIMB 13906 / BL2) TaxID=395965 RepID=B8ESW0_METSB|nr:CHAT domain-containing protein [Methylocella silvestris]ACK50445.1 conserved hypothetical protein [Methylocella silvestris BL2]
MGFLLFSRLFAALAIAATICIHPAYSGPTVSMGEEFEAAVQRSDGSQAHSIAERALLGASENTENVRWMLNLAYASLIQDENEIAQQEYKRACLAATVTKIKPLIGECQTMVALTDLILEKPVSLQTVERIKVAPQSRAALFRNATLALIKGSDYTHALVLLREAAATATREKTLGDPLSARLISELMVRSAEAVISDIDNRKDLNPDVFRNDLFTGLDLAKQYNALSSADHLELLERTRLNLRDGDPRQLRISADILRIAEDDYLVGATNALAAIESISSAGYTDDARLSAWKWQLFIEKKFGRDSPEALEALAHLAGMLTHSSRGNHDDRSAVLLFQFIERRTSERGTFSSSEAGRRLLDYMKNHPLPLSAVEDPPDLPLGGKPFVNESKQPPQTAPGLIKTPSDDPPRPPAPEAPIATQTETAKPPVAEGAGAAAPLSDAVAGAPAALAASNVDSALRLLNDGNSATDFQQAIDLQSRLRKLELENSLNVRPRIREERERLLDGAVALMEKRQLTENWRYRSLITSKADLVRRANGYSEAIKLIDRTLGKMFANIRSKEPSDFDLLKPYIDIVGFEYIDHDFHTSDPMVVQTIVDKSNLIINFSKQKYKRKVELVDDDTGVEGLVSLLIDYATMLENIKEAQQAGSCYKEARRLVGDSTSSFSYETIFDSIAAGLARTSKAPKSSQNKPTTLDKEWRESLKNDAITYRTKIARAEDFDKERLSSDAAANFEAREGGAGYRLEFARAALKYGIQRYEALSRRVILSPSQILVEQQQFLNSSVDEVIGAVLGQKRELTSLEKEELFGAIQWMDSSAAGRALGRAATRAILKPELAPEARLYDKEYVNWSRLQQKLNESEYSGHGVDSEEVEALNKTLQQARRARDNLLSDSAFVKATQLGQIKLKDVQEKLHESEALIRFVEFKLTIYAFIVTRGRVDFVDLGYTDGLAADVDTFVGRVAAKENANEQSRLLYSRLFLKIDRFLSDKKELIIVADNSVAKIPFAALRGGRSASEEYWLGERYAIRMVPSLSAYYVLRNPNGRRNSDVGFVGFGDPLVTGVNCVTSAWSGGGAANPICREPRTLDILQSLGRIISGPARIYSGEEYSVENVVRHLPDSVYALAFATHAVGRNFAGYPALVVRVAPGMSLEEQQIDASAIEASDVGADLVILVGCNTDSADESQEALSGLARAFFEAGARGVVVSRWQINPYSVAELFNSLSSVETHLTTENFPEALRQAMAANIAKSPADWAMFTYVGR